MGSAGQSQPWRGYYQTRNQLAMALEHRSPREVGWWAVRLAKLCAGAVRLDDRPAERIRLRALGAWHGLRGIDGRVVDPGAAVDSDSVIDGLRVVTRDPAAFASASPAAASRGGQPRIDRAAGQDYPRVGPAGTDGGHTGQAE
jgi:hypothetical protein